MDRLDTDLSDLIKRHGYEAVFGRVRSLREDDGNVLTLISNRGLHTPPSEYLLGEIYYVTEGVIKFEDVESVESMLQACLSRLRHKLNEQRWTEIYLIPFGHVVFNMHIKMTVFRTLWIETTDIFYFGENRYGALRRDSRNSLIEEIRRSEK